MNTEAMGNQLHIAWCEKNFEKSKILGKNSKMKSIGISFWTSFRYWLWYRKRHHGR